MTPIIVFPFLIGIPLSTMEGPLMQAGLPAQAGTHDIVATYDPLGLKVGLLVLTLLSVTGAVRCLYLKRNNKISSLGIRFLAHILSP